MDNTMNSHKQPARQSVLTWLAGTMLVMVAWLVPQGVWAANGEFDTPAQAISWYSKGPGCIHLKILAFEKDANRTFDYATFYMKDSQGNKTNFFYFHESDSYSGDKAYIQGKFKNLLGDESLIYLTNDTYWRPYCIIRGGDEQQHDFTRTSTSVNAYVEVDWYYPTRFAGQKMTLGVEAQIYHRDNKQTDDYKKELGSIEFDDIMLEAYDAVPGTDEENASVLSIPVVSDHVMNWVEAKYQDASGAWKTMARQQLEKNSYSAFVILPATEPHSNVTITAEVVAASIEDSNLPDKSWPASLKGTLTKVIDKVGMVHGPKYLTSEVDSAGAVVLKWQVSDKDVDDLLEGDVFDVQRSLTGKEEDFVSLEGSVPYEKDSTNYMFIDSTLVDALTAEQIDAKIGIPLVRYRVARAAIQELWGTARNTALAYTQPQFATLSLLAPTGAEATWKDKEESKIQVTWKYQRNTDKMFYVWDKRAEMRVEVLMYNRAGQRVDSTARVLSDAERRAKKVELTLPRSCVKYEIALVVDGKTSPIGKGEGDIFVVLNSKADMDAFIKRVNSGETKLNAVMTSDIDMGTSGVKNNADNSYMMIGFNRDKPYAGNFNGNGYKLNMDLRGNMERMAPFRFAGEGAVIANLTTSGVAHSLYKFLAGVVASAEGGGLYIENCIAGIKIEQAVYYKDGTSAGLVGVCDKKNSNTSVFISNCLVNCAFDSRQAGGMSGVVGYRDASTFVMLSNTYFNPASFTGVYNYPANATFMRHGGNPQYGVIQDCTYSKTYGEVQGTYSEKAPENDCWKDGKPVMKKLGFSDAVHDGTYRVKTPEDQFYFQSTGKVDPTSLEADTLQSSVLLKWQKTEGNVDFFEVWRLKDYPGEKWEIIATQLSDLEYEDKKVSPVYDYYYKVCSINDCEGTDSTFTAEVLGSCVKTGTVEGYVRFADGTGIPNIRVEASQEGEGASADPSLGGFCITDENGFYRIEGLKYWGEQKGSYHLNVSGVASTDLAENCQDGISVTFDHGSNYERGYTFTVTNGVKFSGLVMYHGTSIPVHGARFMVDNREVRTAAGPVESDFEGKFSFWMTKGVHTIQAVMDGHDFYKGGYYYENNKKDNIDFQTNLAQVYFYDDTKVKLIGRVVGGKKQGDLPLGNSLSTNNLGDNLKMVFALEGDNASWLVFDNQHRSIIERDTIYEHKKYSTLDKNKYSTRVHTTRHRMEVWPDTLTGEYYVELPPVRWKIQQITADGYATLFQEGKTSDVIDLTDSLVEHTDVLKGSWRTRANEDISEVSVTYNARYSRIYRSPVILEHKQVGYDKFDYFGEKSFAMRTLTGEKHQIDIAYPVTTVDEKTKKTVTKTKYTFDYPVFSTDRGYGIKLSAVERYYYNNNVQSDTVEVVKLNGGFVTIRNGFMSGTQRDTLTLDSLGEGNYVLRAAQRPYLATGKDALYTVTFSMERDSVTIEGEPLKGYVFSQYAKPGAKDVISVNTPVLVDILRDPPGGGSSAKLSKGSTLKLAYQMDMAWKGGLSIGINAGIGQDFYTGFGGIGFEYGQIGHAAGVFNTSIDIVFSGTGQRAFAYTMTAAEDISTDAGSTMVGAEADLYMGMETNMFVRPSVAIQAINDSVFRVNGGALAAGRMVEIARGYGEKGDTLHLVRTEVLGYGQTVQSTFVHSQQYIVKQLIPGLAKQCEDLMFTGTLEEAQALANALNERVYLSLIKDQKSDRFATLNMDEKGNYVYNTTNKSHQHGDQSKMNYIIVLPNGDDGSTEEDKVKDYCSTMGDWINMIARNEREKMEASNKMKNFEMDGGGSVSYSEDFSTEYSNTTSYNWLLTDFTHNYFANPDPDKDGYGDIERTRFAMAEMMTILGNTAGKFFAGIFNTVKATKGLRTAGKTTAQIENTQDNPLTMKEISFVGIKWNFSLTPVASFAVTPKNNETTKYNRKESFTIKMDKKSHLDFDVYYATVIDSRKDTEVDSRTDVFVEENFLNNVDYMEYFLDRDVGARDIVHDMVKPRGFIYRTRGGATVRPWEDERKTIFYQTGAVLDERTKKIENPVIKMDKQSISGVPTGEPARFKLYMTNESELPEAIGGGLMYFTLYQDSKKNPLGARMLVDGLPLSSAGITVKVTPGEVTEKTLEVYAGDGFDYEDLVLGLISQGDVQCVQEVAFSVHFQRSAGNLEIASPGDKWIMNTDAPFDRQRGWYMPIIISGFDKNQKNFDHIEFQYKESTRGDDYWTNLCAFYADSALYKQATGVHEMIPENGNIVTKFYGEGTVMEKAYDLRARLFCRNGNSFITNDSKVLTGVKDTRRPQLFGIPEPIDGIIGAGENIIFNFSEAIEHNYLQQATNFEVMGETNETAISEEPSLVFYGDGYAETDARRNFANKNMTIDLMVRPDSAGVNMPLFSHGTDGHRLQLWLTSEWKLKAVIDSISFESKCAIREGSLEQVALILDNDHQQAFLYNDSIIGQYDNITYSGYGPLIFGATNEVDTGDRQHYRGRMLEARLWNRTMTKALLATYGKCRLTGYEMGLADYYPMNDGESSYAVDVAQGANAELHGAGWALPRGMALHLDFDEQKDVKGMKLKKQLMQRSEEQDYTLMFWFQTNNTGQGALVSNGSGRRTDDDAKNKFYIGFESGQLMYRTNGREVLLGKEWADDDWHHFALTVDRSHKVANIYVDQELHSSISTDTLGGMMGDDFYVGNMVWHDAGANIGVLHSQNALTGYIDELCLFAQALPKSLLERYSTKSPSGREKGLLVYMGFNRQEKQENNQMALRPDPLSQVVHFDMEGKPTEQRDTLFVDKLDYVLNHIDPDHGAPVQASMELRTLNFSFVGRDNQLLVNIDEPDARINKRNLYVTVTDIPDMNGNYMASPATMEFFVDRNPLRWERKSWSEEISEFRQEDDYYFEVKVVNNSGSAHTYTVDNMPRWLTVSKQTDVIDPLAEHTLVFSVSADLNVGTYDEIIYLKDENGLAEPLALSIRKNGNTPGWDVDESMRHFSMNVVAQVRIGDVLVTDPQDIVGAFDSQGQCLGMTYVSYNPNTSQSQLFMTLFDSEASTEKPLTFKLWHHETGQILWLNTDPEVKFNAGQVVGAVDNPVVMTAGSLYYQQLYLVPGWNWISFNVENSSFRNPKELLDQYVWNDNDILTDDTEDFTFIYNAKLGKWLTNKGEEATNMRITTERSYRVYVQYYNTIEIPGYPLKDKSQCTIPVKHGWNNIGYTPMVNLPVATAMADYAGIAENRDVVKSRDQFAVYTKPAVGGGYWSGSLQYLKPGEGYMLYRNAEGEASFHYPYYEPGKIFFESTVAQSPMRKVEYAHNMSMAASVEGIELEEGDRLLALCGGEIRGEAVEIDDVYYLSIDGEEKAPLSFAIQRGDDIIATTAAIMNYESNAVSGSPMEPTVINFVYGEGPQDDVWYTLSGIKLPSKPQSKGVYIHNGQRVVIQ